MTTLLVRGGTVVTATGSRRADVLVEGERIQQVEPDLGALARSADEVVDATGLLVLPGCIDVHTHTRIATDTEPDRFFQDSIAAAFGGTTAFLAFNNPGTGVSDEAAGSLIGGLREWQAATADDSAIDYGLSLVLTGRQQDLLRELPTAVEAGVPTAKAFMVYDFRLSDPLLYQAMEELGRLGGMLEVHCEDPVLVDAAIALALQRANTAPRYHATTRSVEAEAVATHRALEFARQAEAPVYIVHLSSAAALDEVRRARERGVKAYAETCPHYLTLTSDRYELPDAEAARYVISPPLRDQADQDELWVGLADGSLSLVATDHVPDRLDREKADATRGVPFDRISNGAPGIETLLTVTWAEGVAKGHISQERLVDLLATTPARLFGLQHKGAIEVGRDADLVLFDPSAQRTIRATDLHHTSDYTAYEGMETVGAVRSVFVRGRPVVRDGNFVGERGFGRFIERQIVPDSEPGRDAGSRTLVTPPMPRHATEGLGVASWYAPSDQDVGAGPLDRVVAVGQSHGAGDVLLDLIALEIREHAAIAHWSMVHPRNALFMPQAAASDDVGTSYEGLPTGSSGSGSASSGAILIQPRPPRDATRLTLEISSMDLPADLLLAESSWVLIRGSWQFEIPLR